MLHGRICGLARNLPYSKAVSNRSERTTKIRQLLQVKRESNAVHITIVRIPDLHFRHRGLNQWRISDGGRDKGAVTWESVHCHRSTRKRIVLARASPVIFPLRGG
ncbi:hypothetical protein KM043_012178 [Ampulex compressa]|nr:hypothetical protein KM043_012178 [Ampulex compressa]